MLGRLRRFVWWAIRRWRTPVWVTKDLRRLRPADMSDDHLQNCLRAAKPGFRLESGMIREKRSGCCPVTAVARAVKRGSCKGFSSCDQRMGADVLGLDEYFADLVADAADESDWTDRRKRLRKQLLEACGLAEVAA